MVCSIVSYFRLMRFLAKTALIKPTQMGLGLGQGGGGRKGRETRLCVSSFSGATGYNEGLTESLQEGAKEFPWVGKERDEKCRDPRRSCTAIRVLNGVKGKEERIRDRIPPRTPRVKPDGNLLPHCTSFLSPTFTAAAAAAALRSERTLLPLYRF